MFNNKSRLLKVIFVFTLSLLITGCGSNSVLENEDKDIIPVQAVREKENFNELTISKSNITDIAKFYPVIVDGIRMEVIVVMASDGTIRTAFNACQVCASSGKGYYIQVGHKLICQNCGNAFDIDELEITRNGCNPAPIDKLSKTEDDEYITIPKETFLANMSLYNY